MTRLSPVLLVALLCAGAPGFGAEATTPGTSAGERRLRVVSLAPNITEIICLIGGADCLVGRTSVCSHPAEQVKDIPVVADFGRPALETLLKLKTTLVLETDVTDRGLPAKLEAQGIGHRHFSCRRLDDIPPMIRTIAELVGRRDAGDKLAAQFEQDLAALRKTQPPEDKRPRTFVEIWPDPLMTAGRDAFIADLVRLAGGRNLGDDLDAAYVEVSSEWVVKQDPAVILCLNESPSGQDPTKLLTRTGWSSIRAVRDRRVYGGYDTNTILLPGPRILSCIPLLRQALLPNGTRQETTP